MSTVSVKLSDATKERLVAVAQRMGKTPHAVMVDAIESTLDGHEKFELFVDAANRSRREMAESGRAFDGDEFGAYLRSKSRGEKVRRPSPRSLTTPGRRREQPE